MHQLEESMERINLVKKHVAMYMVTFLLFTSSLINTQILLKMMLEKYNFYNKSRDCFKMHTKLESLLYLKAKLKKN